MTCVALPSRKRQHDLCSTTKDFYRQYDEWILEPLRRDLPGYVHYRNHIRGHRALGGKPSITRLGEHKRFASPELLDRLESFARHEVKRKVVSPYGYVQMFSRIAYVGRAWSGKEVAFVETLDGLEAIIEGRCVAVMTDYWKFRKLQGWDRRTIPPRLYFQQYERATRPRIAVVLQQRHRIQRGIRRLALVRVETDSARHKVLDLR